MLGGIDYFVVLAYLVAIMLPGLSFRTFVHLSQDLFLAGKALPFRTIGKSIVVSDIGAMDFVGVSGRAYRSGIAVGKLTNLAARGIIGLIGGIMVSRSRRSARW